MTKYRVFVTLFIVSLLLISLGTNGRQAKAYGNSTISITCPMITISATSDRPLTFSGFGQNYIVGHLRNLTTGGDRLGLYYPRWSEVIITGSGSAYIRYHYETSFNLNKYGVDLSPGDQYYFELLDLTGYVGYIKGICNSATYTRNSIPIGYTSKTIMCLANILTSPGGTPLPTSMYPLLPEAIPEVGKQRYVLPVGAVGPDGVVYDKIQADAIRYGYFPRRCL